MEVSPTTRSTSGRSVATASRRRTRATLHSANSASDGTTSSTTERAHAEHERVEAQARADVGRARQTDRHERRREVRTHDRDGCGHGADRGARTRRDRKNLTAAHAEGSVHVVLRRLEERLAHECLRDDHEQGHEGQRGQDAERVSLHLDRPLDLHGLPLARCDEADRLPRGEPLDSRGERVELIALVEHRVHHRAADDARGVRVLERGREVQHRREVGRERRELGG